MGFHLDSAGVVDANGQRIVSNRSGNLSTYTDMTLLTAGTYNKVAELNVLARGSHLISVYWTGGYTASTSNLHWETAGVGVVGIVSATSYYNANPYEPIVMSFTHHHRTVNNPTFFLDSDNSDTSYGKLSLFLKPAVDEKFQGFEVYAQQLSNCE